MMNIHIKMTIVHNKETQVLSIISNNFCELECHYLAQASLSWTSSCLPSCWIGRSVLHAWYQLLFSKAGRIKYGEEKNVTRT